MSADKEGPASGFIYVPITFVQELATTLGRMRANLNIVETYAGRMVPLIGGTATLAERAEWYREALADIPAARDEARELGHAIEALQQQIRVPAAPAGRPS